MLHWLVIGIGDITTKRVFPAILAEPSSRLHAILTRDPGKAVPYSGAKVYTDLPQALSNAAIDAVYIATPVSLHAPQAIASLSAGKHVLCEKPMALNYPEAQSMVAAARTAGRRLGVAYYRRCYPKVQRAQRLVAQGAVGQPVLAYITCHSWLPCDPDFRGWLVDPSLAGGGPLYDIASHRIDVLNFLFGEPCRVSAHLANTVHHYDVEDCATLLIEYASGVRGIVDVRWNSRVDRDEFRIIGTDGELELTPLNGPRLRGPGIEEELPAPANLHFPCVQNFVRHVLEGVPLLSSGDTALWTDWVTEQAVRSAKG
jgi:predicted dehydrogenase